MVERSARRCYYYSWETNSQPWHSIEQGVKRDPGRHHEIPVEGIVAHIAESSFGDMAREHQNRQHHRISQIGEKMGRVQSEHKPGDGAVGVVVPADVELRELPGTNTDGNDAD